MGESRLKRFVIVFAILAVGGLIGMKRKADVGGKAKQEAMAMLAEVDGYTHRKSTYDIYANSAHDTAMDQSYSSGGRGSADRFDHNLYIACFFDNMVAIASQYKDKEMVEKLNEYRTEHHIPIPTR